MILSCVSSLQYHIQGLCRSKCACSDHFILYRICHGKVIHAAQSGKEILYFEYDVYILGSPLRLFILFSNYTTYFICNEPSVQKSWGMIIFKAVQCM